MREIRKYLVEQFNPNKAINEWSLPIVSSNLKNVDVDKYTNINEESKPFNVDVVDGISDRLKERIKYTAVLSEAKRINKNKIAGNMNYLNEDGYGGAIPSEITGAGAVTNPDIASDAGAFYDTSYKSGSGDQAMQLLGLQTRLGLRTVGFDLLPVIPMDKTFAQFTYMDTIYSGGKLDEVESKPLYIKIGGSVVKSQTWDRTAFAPGVDIVIAGTNSSNVLQDGTGQRCKVMRYSRFGDLIVKVLETVTVTASSGALALNTTKSIDDMVLEHDRHAILPSPTATTSTLGSKVDLGAKVDIDYASTVDNPVYAAANRDGVTDTPMARVDAEKGTENTIGLQLHSKQITTQSYKILTTFTREQARQAASYGLDVAASLYQAAEEAIQNSINNHIVKTISRLGVTNHAAIYAGTGANLNLYIAPATSANKAFTNFKVGEFVGIDGVDKKATFGNITNSETNSAAENQATRQRRIISRMAKARDIIKHYSRRGAGNFAIVSSDIATAIEDVKGFTAAPFNSMIPASESSAITYKGNVVGLDIYVHEDVNDNLGYGVNGMKICVGRRGNESDAGLKFFAYDLADSISTIAEGTMSEKTLIESTYALTPVGYHPETNYLTFGVDNGFGDSFN